MTEPTVWFVPLMTAEQREIYRELRHQQLEMTPFPDRPLVQPTIEEIERVHAQMTAPHSPPLLHQPPEPLPQPEPVRARRNSHPQLTDKQRKMVEGIIRNHEGTPTVKWLARSAGITEVYSTILLRRFRENGTLAVKKDNRGRKSKVGMAQLEFLRQCMTENCRLKDRELAELMRVEYEMSDKPFSGIAYGVLLDPTPVPQPNIFKLLMPDNEELVGTLYVCYSIGMVCSLF